jgi:hypothetical protein
VALNESVCVAATPFPANGTAPGEFAALLVIETLPLVDPVEAGEKFTLNVLDCPGLRDIGRTRTPGLNPVPVTVTCVIVSTPFPLLLTFKVWEFTEPTTTFPKFTVAGVTVSAVADTVSVRFAVWVFAGLLASLTLTVNGVFVTDCVGVPEIVPVAAFSARPAGSEPEVMLQL